VKLGLLHDEGKLQINVNQDIKIQTRKMKSDTELERINFHPEMDILEK
jgi:hypothetical protein